jgi:Cu/Ag efflux pump CusA
VGIGNCAAGRLRTLGAYPDDGAPGLGLLPLALGSGDPGREIEGPMAIVILGGLVTSTALNLLVLPTLALRFGRFVRHESTSE